MAKKLTLPVKGMTCASCVAHVEGALQEIPGVVEARVNLPLEQATVEYDPERVGIPTMAKAVKEVGYEIPETTILLKVSGMTCASCVEKITPAVSDLEAVGRATVN